MTVPEMESAENEEKEQTEKIIEDSNSIPKGVSLCKAFRAEYVHGTLYTGGKVIMTSTHGGIRSLLSNTNEKNGGIEDEDVQISAESSSNVTLLALSEGDISMINSSSGIQTHTIRTGSRSLASSQSDITTYNNNDEQIIADDDDDEMLDMDSILNFALSPNDQILVTSARNNLLRVYNLSLNDSNKAIQEGPGPSNIVQTIGRAHEAPIKAMEFHPSNAFLVTGAVDGVVKVWDMRAASIMRKDAGKEKMVGTCFVTHCYRIGAGIVGGVSALAWAPMPKSTHPNNESTQLSLSTNSIPLAMGFENGRVDVVDLVHSTSASSSNQQQAITIGNSNESNKNLTKTQSGGIIVIGGMEAHVSAVTDMTWGGDDSCNDIFITVGRDEVVNVWSVEVKQNDDLKNDENKRKKKKRRKVDLNVTQSNTITYKRIFTHPIYEHIESVQVILSSKSNIHLATAGSKGFIRVWNVSLSDIESKSKPKSIKSMECIHTQTQAELPFGEDRGGYTQLLLHPSFHDESVDGKQVKELIAVDAHQNFTYFTYEYDPSSSDGSKNKDLQYNFRPGRTIVGYNDEIIDLKVLSPHNKIVVVTNSPQLRLFDFSQKSFSCYCTLNGHKETVLCMDVSADGFWIASAGKDRSMILWDVEKKRQVAFATGHTEAIGAVALSRKRTRYALSGDAIGAFAVTASKDRTLKKWSLPSSDSLRKIDDTNPMQLKAVASVRAHDKDINIVTVSPNDSLIATGSQDKTVKLWSTTDLSLQRTLTGHKRGIWDCQFSPIDRILATASGDKTIKLWSLSDGKCVRTFQGHGESVLRVRFLSGGLQLVSSGGDGLLKLWTIRTNECETTLDGHSDKVWALDTRAENSLMLVSGGADSRLVVWTDITREQEDEKRKAEEENILMEQKLSNHLRFKEYEQALELALELDKPHMALKVLTSLVENSLQEKNENAPNADTDKVPLQILCRHVQGWTLSRIHQILRYCRDWNTRARNSYISMMTVRAIFSSVPVAKLAANGDYGNIPELFAGITPYAERHMDRLDKLYGSSYMIDFVLHMMGRGLEDDIDDDENDEVNEWLRTSKYVLPPNKQEEEKIQLKGVVKKSIDIDKDDADDEIITIGESDTESEGGDENDIEEDDIPTDKVKGSLQEEVSTTSSNSGSSASS